MFPNFVHDLGHLGSVGLVAGDESFKNAPLSVGEDVGSHSFSTRGDRIIAFRAMPSAWESVASVHQMTTNRSRL
jgi:hypothetical protein